MSLETMTKLATTTVGAGGAATIDFTNIPQNYTDLVVKISSRSTNTSTARGTFIAFNSSTSGYTDRFLRGEGAATYSATNNGGGSKIYLGEATASGATANTFSNIEVYIPNYAGSNNKSVIVDSVQEHNATEAYVTLVSGLWSNVTAINSLSLTTSLNLEQHSTATLYGVKNARQTAGNSIKATGGNIVFDGTYVYHVFPTTNSFTPTQPILADVLVIAGGGAGGSGQGGGGGAGGLLLHSTQSLTATNYTCTIGAGAAGVNNGTAPISPGTTGSNGTDSTFGTLASAIGGGGGSGYRSGSSGSSGGSGGGGGGRDTGGAQAGGSGTAGPPRQGFNGGTGLVGALYGGGGGGGAGGAGANGNSSTGGAGGIGSSAYSSWLQATGLGESSGGVFYIAAGGAGGLDAYGGLGGGGDSTEAGGMPITVINGLANTGSGGGGYYTNRGSGGSGIVIIRYKG